MTKPNRINLVIVILEDATINCVRKGENSWTIFFSDQSSWKFIEVMDADNETVLRFAKIENSELLIY